MPLYTPGRRRAIVLLLLTSVLLLTLDLRGNAIFDAVRSGFNSAMEPLESAADVVTRPVVNAWRGITQYEQLREQNDRYRDELAAQRADQIAAQAAIQDQRELLAERDLPTLGDHTRITATVVGISPTNLDQVVQINKGRDAGIEVGMAVVGPGGLVGKITTPLLADRAYVMLVTDSRYATSAKVIAPAPPPPPPTTTTTTLVPPASVPPETVAPSVPADETVPGTTAAPETTAPPPTLPVETAPPESTTTTIDLTLERDTGLFVGRGPSALPQVDLLSDAPALGGMAAGDLVFTAGGGGDSLAPPDIPIGTVRNVIRRSSSQGTLLEIELAADVDRLYFVDIIAYVPASEAGSEPPGSLAGGG